eukprot:scaffold164296_cov47-Attheya_sp.AAC.1
MWNCRRFLRAALAEIGLFGFRRIGLVVSLGTAAAVVVAEVWAPGGNGLKWCRMSMFSSLDSGCSTTKPSASRGINAPAWTAAVRVLRAAHRCA